MKESIRHADYDRAMDLAYWAWTIIANAYGGNWDEASEGWRDAATLWRDGFHAELDRGLLGIASYDYSERQPEWERRLTEGEVGELNGSVWTPEQELNERAQRYADEMEKIFDRDPAPTEGGDWLCPRCLTTHPKRVERCEPCEFLGLSGPESSGGDRA